MPLTSNNGKALTHRSGPPKSRPLLKKAPHRRSPHACDECRLRKRACDAAEPCGPCRNSGLGCTYNFRRPVPPPTLRIRKLQDHLNLARLWLQEVHEKVPEIPGMDIENCLRSLDFTLPETQSSPPPSPPSPASHGPGPKQATLRNMLAGHYRLMNVGSETYFYGPYSELSFILRTLELFQQHPPISPDRRFLVVSNLFNLPLPQKDNAESSLTESLLPRNTVMALVDAIFTRTHPMLSFLSEQHVKDTANLLTASQPPALPPQTVSLFHMSLALGYLFDSPRHREEGCQEMLRQATNCFHIGLAMVELMQVNDLTSLQAILCAIIFLVSTSRITSAHSLIGTACSSALRLGLHFVGSQIGGFPAEESKQRIRLLATIMRLDLFTSIILDLPPFLQPDAVLLARIARLASEAEAQKDLQTAANLRQVCLLAIPLSKQKHSSIESVDIGHFEEAKNEFQSWQADTFTLLTSLVSTTEHKIIRHDLDMTFNFCHIIVFQPLLHYLRIMADGGTIPVAQSYHALACIKIASSTIVRSHEMMNEGLFLAGFCSSIYTVFMSVMCLIFLIAAHRGTSRPGKAWQRAGVGIRFISAYTCVDDCSTRCLEVLKMVINELSHTVYFNVEEIKASTTRHCDRIHSRTDCWGYPGTIADDHREDTHHEGERPLEVQPTAYLDFDVENNHIDQEHEVDRMLSQAERL